LGPRSCNFFYRLLHIFNRVRNCGCSECHFLIINYTVVWLMKYDCR